MTDAADLEAWLGDVLRHGAGRERRDPFRPRLSRRRRRRSARSRRRRARRRVPAVEGAPSRGDRPGPRVSVAVTAAWPNARLTRLSAALPTDPPFTYPVAVAIAAAAHDVPLAPALTAYPNRVRRQHRLGRGARHPDRPDRRPAHHRRARPAVGESPRAALGCRARPSRRRHAPRRHRRMKHETHSPVPVVRPKAYT